MERGGGGGGGRKAVDISLHTFPRQIISNICNQVTVNIFFSEKSSDCTVSYFQANSQAVTEEHVLLYGKCKKEIREHRHFFYSLANFKVHHQSFPPQLQRDVADKT